MSDRFYESDTENAPECECLHEEQGVSSHAEPCKENSNPK